MELESMSNNEILFMIKKMEVEHDAIKTKMVSDYDKLVALEKDFEKATNILQQRLKVNNGRE